MKTPKMPKHFSRAATIPNEVERLRAKKVYLTTKLRDVDAKIADLEMEWADVQKEITDVLFGRTSLEDVSGRGPASSWPKKKRKKKAKKRVVNRGKRSQARPKTNDGGLATLSRAEIQAAAKKRDASVIALLKKSKRPMSINDLLGKVAVNSTLSQMQTSIKRMRKLISRVGTGMAARYTLKGKG